MRIFQNMFRSNIQKLPETNDVQAQKSSQPDFWNRIGVKPDSALQQAVSRLNNHGVEVGKDEVMEIKHFLRQGEGSTASKLETVDIAASKGVELTQENLTAIHGALNDQGNIEEAVKALSADGNDGGSWEQELRELGLPEDVITSIKQAQKSGKSTLEAVADALAERLPPGATVNITANVATLRLDDGERVIIMKQMSVMLTITYTEGVPEALSALFAGEGEAGEGQTLLDMIDQVVQGNMSVEQLAQRVLDLAAATEDGARDVEETQDAKEDVKTASVQSQAVPTETDQSQDWTHLLDDLAEAIESVADRLGASGDEFMDMAGAALETSPVKLFLVTEVTEKMEEVRLAFSAVQRDLSSRLTTLLDQPTTSEGKAQMAELLEKAVDLLDKTIMKSDIMLYTDMKLEKQLLNDSSKLQEARNWLHAGNTAKAKEIITTVRTHVQTAVFAPSEQKVKAFAAGSLAQVMDLQPGAQMIAQGGQGARGIMEILSGMGLNHEAEVGEEIQRTKNGQVSDMDIKDNLKTVLLKMLEEEDPSSRGAVSGASKALGNLIGQQLLNRLENKSDTQTLFFSIPLQLQQEVQEMKLYVNSRKNGDKMDWENATLYFSIDLQAYGETGIRMQARDKTLSITVKNDHGELKSVMEPLLQGLAKEFEDIGYVTGPVRFTPLSDEIDGTLHSRRFEQTTGVATPEPSDQASVPEEQATDAKGFEWKI